MKRYKGENFNLSVSLKLSTNAEKIRKQRIDDGNEEEDMITTKIQDFKCVANNLDVRRKTLANFNSIVNDVIEDTSQPENVNDYFVEYNSLQNKRKQIYENQKNHVNRIF